VPGGVARIRLGRSEDAPRVHLGADRVLVVRDGAERIALVGIALATKPGAKLHVEAQRADGKVERVNFLVGRKGYATQRLKVAPAQAELSPEDLARYERERAHLAQVLRTFSEAPPATLALLQPAPGTRSSSFGLRRYFNGQQIILDHGEGLLTLYAHLSGVDARVGENVDAGAPIGKVGATERGISSPSLSVLTNLADALASPAERRDKSRSNLLLIHIVLTCRGPHRQGAWTAWRTRPPASRCCSTRARRRCSRRSVPPRT
jgi:murein DD-endopeptidase MepM/ murein hydrolase activator NlpD